MKKIRILAVEDNPLHQENIMLLLDAMGYDLAGVADNASDALQLLISVQPDLLLMDIEIIGEQDGVQLAEKVSRIRPTPIIFTTALKDTTTMARASAMEPYAYLIKPLEENNLQAAIELAVYRFAKERERKEAGSVLPIWDNDVFFRDSLFTKQGGKLVKIPFDEILAISVSKDRYCSVQTKTEAFMVRSSLSEIAQKLPSNIFIQVHRSHLIMARAITSIDEAEGAVQLGSLSIPMGKSYREPILKMLNMI